MAELYLARQTGEGGYEKVVAVKRVLPHLAEDAPFVEMFLNEARLAANLDHENIAHVLDFGSDAGEHFMAMEYVHGRPVLAVLRESLKRGGMPPAIALTIIHEIAAALHYAHDRKGPDGRALGLVHRDVSPSNVLVSFEGGVKLVDFGIAKATAHTRVTRSGAIKGKLGYMAPEQVRGEDFDRRADVWALTVVAYELLLGRRCFRAPGEFALINRVAEGRYEKPSNIRPEFPPDLEAIIVKGLSVDADDRYATARELQRAVEDFAAGNGHRLSKVALADYMEALFGAEDYPTTTMLPPPDTSTAGLRRVGGGATLPDTGEEVTKRTRPAKRPAVWMLAGGALVVGIALGVGLPRWLDREDVGSGEDPDEPEAAAPAAVASPRAEPDPRTPAESPADDSAPSPVPAADEVAVPVEETEPEEEIVVLDDDPAEPTRKPGRRGRNKRKKADSDAAAGDSKKTKTQTEWLPPSRR